MNQIQLVNAVVMLAELQQLSGNWDEMDFKNYESEKTLLLSQISDPVAKAFVVNTIKIIEDTPRY